MADSEENSSLVTKLIKKYSTSELGENDSKENIDSGGGPTVMPSTSSAATDSTQILAAPSPGLVIPQGV